MGMSQVARTRKVALSRVTLRERSAGRDSVIGASVVWVEVRLGQSVFEGRRAEVEVRGRLGNID